MAAHRGSPPMPTIELNDEERAVLRECRVNSIYFRGIPLGVISALIMRQGIASGHFPHMKRFSKLYYPGIFGLGFLAGVISYRKTCLNKIMRLEKSQLADQVRSFYKQAGITDQIIGLQSIEDIQSQTESGFYDESQAFSREEGIADRSFTMSSPLGIQNEDTKQPDRYTSYEELRKRNRNQWMQSPKQPSVNHQRPEITSKKEPTGLKDADYHSPIDTYQSDISSTMWSEESTSEHSDDNNKQKGQRRTGPAPRKNAYGDVLEK